MKGSIVIIGIGEIGGIFARSFLKLGYVVYPVTRDITINDIVNENINPSLVLVTVNENSLQEILKNIPKKWSDKLILVQNELLPKDYSYLNSPTIISIWFEKKKGQDSKEIISSPVYGPKSAVIQQALETLGLNSRIITSHKNMTFELVVKNVYILTTNIAGLKVGGNVGNLWKNHNDLVINVSHDIISIQQALLNKSLDREKILLSVLNAFNGDPEHKCMGRSAPDRLKRAIADANELNVDVPTLKEISREYL